MSARTAMIAALRSAVGYGVALDWIRLVFYPAVLMQRIGDEDAGGLLRLMVPYSEKKEVVRRWRLQEYVGWSAGQWSVGFNGRMYMLEVRGSEAAEAFILYGQLANRCTRMDIAYDLELGQDSVDLATLARLHWEEVGKKCRRLGAEPVAGLFEKGDECTYNLGRRDGSKYFRLYNKSAEQGWPVNELIGRFWRIELELKRAYCQQLFETMKAGPQPFRIAGRALRQYMYDAGFPVWELQWEESLPLKLRVRREKSAEQSLRWIKRQVRPCIDKLRAAGYNEIIDSLLLDKEWTGKNGKTRRRNGDNGMPV